MSRPQLASLETDTRSSAPITQAESLYSSGEVNTQKTVG